MIDVQELLPAIERRKVAARIVNNQIQVEDVTVLDVTEELVFHTRLIPNPAAEQVQIKLPLQVGFESLSLLNAQGKLLLEYPVSGKDE
ncbi:MAG: hypothetical protein ACLFQ0_00125 [Cyclobacteriaceae bacterium]